MVAQALQDRSWVADIKGTLTIEVFFFFFGKGTIEVLLEYLQLDTPDQYQWRLARSGSYSSKSAYVAFFTGTIKSIHHRRAYSNHIQD
jgi:hypothetical protein